MSLRRLRLLPALFALVLVLSMLPLPGVAASAATAEEALRLYGCMDLLAGAEAQRHVAVPVPGAATRGASDGVVDCAGDRLHLEPAWLDADASPFLRAALSPRDQSIHPSLRYLPAAWFPAPGHGASALADPLDGRRGLFDVTPGTLGTPAYALSGEEPARRVHPSDGAPDLMLRHDAQTGLAADHHFPALEFETRYHWHRGEDRPATLPPGASFVFPFAAREGPAPGLQGWDLHGTPRATSWYPTPFGVGVPGDGAGALALVDVPAAPGDVVRFLDHSIRVLSVQEIGGLLQVSVEVRYEGNRAVEVLQAPVTLTLVGPGGEEGQAQDASLQHPGLEAQNVVFAGRTGTQRDVPAVPGPSGTSGVPRPWFVLLESVQGTASGEPSARLSVGRLVSERAPWNLFFVDGAMYRVSALGDRPGGGLATLGITQLVPLGEAHHFAAAQLTVVGLAAREPLAVPAPLSAAHVRLRTLAIGAHTDAAGFLADKDGHARALLGNRHVGPAAPFDAPRERTERAAAVLIQWRGIGLEPRLVVAGAPAGGETDHTVSVVQPTRYVELILPPARYRVDSALLADPGAPFPFASFLYEPGRGPFLFADRAGNVRLAGGAQARAESGDWLHPDPALLPSWGYPGLIRTSSELAHERVSAAIGYRPLHTWLPRGLGLVASEAPGAGPGPLVDSAAGRGNQLHAVEPRNEEVAIGDIYGPSLVLRYRYELVSRSGFEQVSPSVGAGAQLLLPVSSRHAGVPGLDSFDMDGNGRADAVRLASWWVPADTGWVKSTAGDDVGVPGLPRGFLALQSAPLQLPHGRDAQFFDHGVRFQVDSDGDGALELLDLSALDDAQVMARWDAAAWTVPTCISVRFDRSVVGPLDCDAVSPDAAGGGHLWWAEVVVSSPSSLGVQMNRLAAPSNWANPGDASRFYAAGGAYAWRGLETTVAAPGEARDLFRALTLEQNVPLAGDVHVPWRDGELRLLGAMTGSLVPFAPPFSEPHERLQMFEVPLARDAAGFLASVDGELTALAAGGRLQERAPLEVRVLNREVEAAQRFVFVDATRAWEPGREGVSFLAGHFSGPPSGLFPGVELARLDPSPGTGFPEVRTSAALRGWDHRLALALPAGEPFVLDTARLGQPGQVATWLDRARLQSSPDVTAALLPHPTDAATNPLVARASAWWLVSGSGATDPYVIVPITREPPGAVVPPPPAPVDPQGEEENARSEDERTGPGVALALFVLALAILIRRGASHRVRGAAPPRRSRRG